MLLEQISKNFLFVDEFNIDFSRLISEYPLDKDMRVSIEKVENVKEVLCKGCQEKIENSSALLVKITFASLGIALCLVPPSILTNL